MAYKNMTKEEKKEFLEQAIRAEAKKYFEQHKRQFKKNKDGEYEVDGFLLQDDIFNWGSTFNNLVIANEVEEIIKEEKQLLENEKKILVREVCKYDPDEITICKNVTLDNEIVHYDIIGTFDGQTDGIERTRSTEVINKVEKLLKEIGYEIYHEICEYDG